MFGYRYAVVAGRPVIRYDMPDALDGNLSRSGFFLPGATAADIAASIGELSQAAAESGEPLRLYNLPAAAATDIVASAGDEYAVDHMRAYSDYLYSRKDLEELHGRRYQPKRNHINRFMSLYDYRAEPLRATDAEECMALVELWREEHHTPRSADIETQVLRRAFDAYDELQLHGVALRIDGRMAAFSFGSYAGDDRELFCVHAEKADMTYEGIYAMVCNLLVRSLDGRCVSVDREEDLGIEGLRRSKQSWQPVEIVDKYTAVRLSPEQRDVRRLWHEVFGDDRESIDAFLVRYYSPERCVVRYEGGRLAAMAHIVPMDTGLGRTAYIYAVATDAAFRGRGLGRSVVEECIDRARDLGCEAAALIPSDEGLKSFYSSVGFADRDMPMVFAPDYDFGTGDALRDRAMCMAL